MDARRPCVLVTRPEGEAQKLVRALAGRGIEAMSEPLLTIENLPGPAPDLGGVQALLVTSANGLRAFAARSTERAIPVLAVGEASAAAAREVGFTRVESAGGDVEALARLVRERLRPANGALLQAAASAVAGDLKGRLEAAGFAYRRAVLYAARPATALSAPTLAAMAGGRLDGVLFFSPRTARAFVTLVGVTSVDCRDLVAFCLSQAVAAAASALTWGAIETAAAAESNSLLGLVAAKLRPETEP
jgi:uroporphyrinogen-III synthase